MGHDEEGQTYLEQPPQFLRAIRAVMFVDVVEYVRLIEHDEEGVVTRWLSFVRDVEKNVLPSCEGRLVQRCGDGLLLEFCDVSSAVRAAFAIKGANQRDNADLPPDQRISLRVGIEVSDVLIERGEVFGQGVNRAARLTTLAGPGEIVVSARARDQLTPTLDADVEDLGDCYLKHIQQPVHAYRIGPPGAPTGIKPGITLGELLPTIAIIPFRARNVEPDYLMLGEIIAEEVIRDISRSPNLKVISRLSTSVLSGRDISFAEISARLQADYVLSGSYRVKGDEVRLDAELAEIRTSCVVWSQRLASRIDDILDGEQELIRRLVADVRDAVTTCELDRARLNPLPTLRSYTLLMAAITLMHRLCPFDFEEARRVLMVLIDRASRQSIAQAWLAKWHVLRVQQGWSTDPHQDAQIALRCTKQALDTDPECSLALAIDGFVHTNLLKRFDIAANRYELAIKTNPSESLAWLLKGTMHAFMGEGTPAVECTQRAINLSPLDPHRYFYDSLAATAYNAAEQYEKGLEAAQRSLRANRTHTSTLRSLAVAQWQLGLEEDARKTVEQLLQLEPHLTVSGFLERSPAAAYRTGQQWANALRQAGLPN